MRFEYRQGRRALQLFLLLVLLVPLLNACATVVASAGSGLAGNLTTAMMNQDDPAIVRDGAPAYLLMLDSFVEGSPGNSAVLAAAAELYSAYGVVFVDEPLRAQRLTARAQSYGQRAICAVNRELCDSWELPYDEFIEQLEFVKPKQADVLFTYGLSWIAYIQAHGDDFTALSQLPQAEAILRRVRQLNPDYRAATIEHYLGILNTIRPPALGGNFEAGLAHFERALDLSEGHDLSIKVDFANYYARTLYERELHDRLLQEVMAANPKQRGYTLFNTLAQENAQELLDSADDYF